MTTTVSRRQRAKDDKRERVLRAALELIPQLGLHNTPMAAIAQRAGVAKGTPYLYFESKEVLINELYRELTDDREREAALAAHTAREPREQFWAYWSNYARWHLERPDAANFIQQCEASGILTEEMRARSAERQEAGHAAYERAVGAGFLRDEPVQVFFSHYFGPILALIQMREKGEVEITEAILRVTFEGIIRAVWRPEEARPGRPIPSP
jgi:TetR/AcrR family transcriptional regulator, repressor of fatR-cypB operon